MYSTEQYVDVTEKIRNMFSVYHDQKDGSEFSDVTLASEDDNDISDLNECDQEVNKTPIEDYGQDVIFNRSNVNILITFN